jgi:hypothetical protein
MRAGKWVERIRRSFQGPDIVGRIVQPARMVQFGRVVGYFAMIATARFGMRIS